MNGSRLQEHRKRRVPAINWLVLVAVIAAIFAVGSGLSKGATPEMMPFHGADGTVVVGGEVCKATVLDVGAVSLLKEWTSISVRLDQYLLDGAVHMTAEEAERGHLLNSTGICGKLATTYDVIVTERLGQYLLFQYDPKYRFPDDTYIVHLGDFLSNRGL